MCRYFPEPDYTCTVSDYIERLEFGKLDAPLFLRVFNDLVFVFKSPKGKSKLRPSKYWIILGHRGMQQYAIDTQC